MRKQDRASYCWQDSKGGGRNCRLWQHADVCSELWFIQSSGKAATDAQACELAWLGRRDVFVNDSAERAERGMRCVLFVRSVPWGPGCACAGLSL